MLIQWSNYKNSEDLHVNLHVILKEINTSTPKGNGSKLSYNCEIRAECNFKLLVSHICSKHMFDFRIKANLVLYIAYTL